jgi:hypothetical protein
LAREASDGFVLLGVINRLGGLFELFDETEAAEGDDFSAITLDLSGIILKHGGIIVLAELAKLDAGELGVDGVLNVDCLFPQLGAPLVKVHLFATARHSTLSFQIL